MITEKQVKEAISWLTELKDIKTQFSEDEEHLEDCTYIQEFINELKNSLSGEAVKLREECLHPTCVDKQFKDGLCKRHYLKIKDRHSNERN